VERFEVTKEENRGRRVKDFTCKYLVLQGVFENQGKRVKPPFKDSKSVVPQGTVGSNPTPSAIFIAKARPLTAGPLLFLFLELPLKLYDNLHFFLTLVKHGVADKLNPHPSRFAAFSA